MKNQLCIEFNSNSIFCDGLPYQVEAPPSVSADCFLLTRTDFADGAEPPRGY